VSNEATLKGQAYNQVKYEFANLLPQTEITACKTGSRTVFPPWKNELPVRRDLLICKPPT
jgi:hypothetical protein